MTMPSPTIGGSIELRPTVAAWSALGRLYGRRQEFAPALAACRAATEIDGAPSSARTTTPVRDWSAREMVAQLDALRRDLRGTTRPAAAASGY